MSMLPATRSRRRLTVLSAAVALIGGGVVAGNLAGAASGPSAVDYAQCQNGAPGTSPSPDCAWINGILNANASQYHEDQVTAQRLLVVFPDNGNSSHSHSVTLRYLDRKGGIHAYDYLAAADATMADAVDLRCLGLAASICPAGTQAGGAPSTVVSTPDGDHLGPVSGVYSDVISSHMAGLTTAQKTIKLFGATFSDGLGSNPPAMSDPTHDCLAPCTGDDYATVKFSFTTPAGNGPHYVQLMFGGHLAAGSQLDGWGTGLGAASVSGGPYHIKWDAADDSSVGNRDNQIMSNAIIPIVAQGTGLATSPTPNGAVAIGTSSLGSVSDGATLTIADPAHAPSGSVEFDLYGPFTNQPLSTDSPKQCVDPATGVTGNRLHQYTDTTVTADPTDLTGTKYLASSDSFNLAGASGFGIGWYQWVAHYIPGSDQYNLAADGGCFTTSEQLHVTQATPAGSSSQKVQDVVTVTGFGTPSGTVNWYLYKTSDCTNANTGDLVDSDVVGDGGGDSNNTLSGGIATSKLMQPVPANGGTTYYWLVTYSGDTNNASGTVEACGAQRVTIQNHP